VTEGIAGLKSDLIYYIHKEEVVERKIKGDAREEREKRELYVK
jgi:hypothetical protein